MTFFEAALADPWIAYALGYATMAAIWTLAQLVVLWRVSQWDKRR